jgi:hypothetical protein
VSGQGFAGQTEPIVDTDPDIPNLAEHLGFFGYIGLVHNLVSLEADNADSRMIDRVRWEMCHFLVKVNGEQIRESKGK